MKPATIRYMLLALFTCIVFIFTSCTELAVNPLLFDGAPVSADFTLNTSGRTYDGSTTIPLADIISGIDREIDSLAVINITLLIDHVTLPTTGTTTISGTGSIDGNTLLTLTNVPLSTFSAERSIFDPLLPSAGCSFNTAGVTYLNNMLKHPESLPASVTIRVSGGSSSSGLYFQTHMKLYTQVFTMP